MVQTKTLSLRVLTGYITKYKMFFLINTESLTLEETLQFKPETQTPLICISYTHIMMTQ